MAAAVESPPSGGPGAVRLPRSPPLKVLAGQLRRHAEGGPGAWRLSRAAVGRAPLELAVVWMQGTVLVVEGGQARLRDPSGAFSVRGLERVPRGRPCLIPGKGGQTGSAGGCPSRGRGGPTSRHSSSFLSQPQSSDFPNLSTDCYTCHHVQERRFQPDLVVHTFHPNTRRLRQEDGKVQSLSELLSEFEAKQGNLVRACFRAKSKRGPGMELTGTALPRIDEAQTAKIINK